LDSVFDDRFFSRALLPDLSGADRGDVPAACGVGCVAVLAERSAEPLPQPATSRAVSKVAAVAVPMRAGKVN
jgi:hypothetical protein